MEENIKPKINKKEKIKLAVLVASILMIVSSLSYAFFVAATSTPAITDVDLTTETSEALIFTPGTPINLTANLTNFAENAGSLTESTTSTATLRAASSVGSATEEYYVYFNIKSNDFEYTVDANTPEMLLTITDPEGNEIIDIDGLTHKTVRDAKTSADISGFDVTTYEGLIAVKELYSITTTSEKVENWTATITFVNLNSDQTGNEGKTFDSEFILRQGEVFNLKDQILVNNNGKTAIEGYAEPDFSQVATNDQGMFAATDDYGTSYYFRGAVADNWVKFADMYWRIVRINGDGSVRLIYSGTVQPDETQAVTMLTGTNIGTSAFNSAHNSVEYTGYMYTIGQQHGLTTESTIKQTIDTWYENNILGTEYETKLSDTSFCGDRTSYTDEAGTTAASGTGSTTQYFGGYVRLETNKTPSLVCLNNLDAYTVSDTINGNGALDYPVGLISVDEVAFAGAVYGSNNSDYYLYTNSKYWLGTPYNFGYSSGIGFRMDSYGGIGDGRDGVQNSSDVRPLVSLGFYILATGSGTWNDPYVVS